MGCFLACFGSSKDHSHRRRRRHLNHVSSAVDPNPSNHYKLTGVKSTPSFKQGDLEKPTSLIEDSGFKTEEQPISNKRVQLEGQLSSGTRKKVTFDSNITVYERVSVDEFAENVPDDGKEAGNDVVGDKVKPSNLASASEEGSSSSSLDCYRYQNCRESDDEDEELDHEQGDFEVNEDDENGDDYGDYDEFCYEDSDDECYSKDVRKESSPVSFSSLESRTESSESCMVNSEINDQKSGFQAQDGGKKTLGSDCNARDRSCYVNTVLNPVENTAQWKFLKSKGTGVLKLQKENLSSQEEQPWQLVGKDSSLEQSSVKLNTKSNEPKHDQEVRVDASLSNWLVSSEKTPTEKSKTAGLKAIVSETSASSHGSNSLLSEEDRPILGALTVEEFKQFSASSTTKRSPSRNPADTPLIGTAGANWINTSPVEGCGSASSFKGIPNTTSKYREVFIK
ncbi:hypothetical protein Dimus_016371 [Dionaea muscipula]